jgi:ribosomal protein S18 acetylase RimI-like enzyme
MNMSGVTDIEAKELLDFAPDAHLTIRAPTGDLLARCSLWWTTPLWLGSQRVGRIGHYAAASASAGEDILDRACDELRAKGCSLAVGPMDGTTWRRYRLVTQRGAEPPFFLEPDNPDEWVEHFHRARFECLAKYCSLLSEDLRQSPEQSDVFRARLARAGVRLRTFDLSRVDDEMEAVYRLSLEAFAQAFLYSPVDKRQFLDQYRRLLPIVRPEFFFIAESDNQPIGFVFAIPDCLEERRGCPAATVIIKTLAMKPAFAGRGVGKALMAEVCRAAQAIGVRRAIFALVHEANQSCLAACAALGARKFRTYTLFGRENTSRAATVRRRSCWRRLRR